MVSKSQLKLITGLQQKKYRNKHKLFIAEGPKVIQEFLNSRFALHGLFTTQADEFSVAPDLMQHITDRELKSISNLTTPNKALALFKIPPAEAVEFRAIILALDAVNDPGNLGTIIRLCDWFGVTHIVCSHDTVDCYNAKVVQASMGSLARVYVSYVDLPEFLSQATIPVFASGVAGNAVYTVTLPKEAVLIMGNEANGISEGILSIAQERVAIPNFSHLQQAESLNVATATAILLSEFRRRL
ncbi:MAG: RNA methyltransferase [Bacteroidota bacterium]